MNSKDKETKDKKKKARKAMLLLLGKLNKKCGSFKKLDEWYTFLKQNLDPVISEFRDQIPSDTLNNLEKAKKLTDHSQEAINKACDNLKWNLDKVIKLLPKHSPLVKILLVGTALTSGIVAAAVLYANSKSVTINVKNNGCDTIYPVVYLPVQIPGLKMFDTPIANGRQESISIYPLPVTVDATRKDSVLVSLFGITLPYNLSSVSSGATEIKFDGQSLLGKKTSLDLRNQPEHELVISCR